MVLIFPNLCLWQHSLRSTWEIDPEKLYRATLKALNVEEIEVRKPWTVESLIKRQSCQIVLKITSVPLLKDILQKLNSTLTLETIWSTKTPQS